MEIEQLKNKIHHADCMDIMKDIPDNYIDLAIVDPPYGIGSPNMNMGSNSTNISTAERLKKNRLNSGSGKLKNRILNQSDCSWDCIPDENYFNELFRISKNQIIWGGNYFDLKPTRCIICWDKIQPWENFSQWEMAWTSFDKPASIFKYSNRGGANKEPRIHPTQKPIALYRWQLQKYAKIGDFILDTHSGSGSLACACHIKGFNFIAIEKNYDYWKESIERFEIEKSQLKLF